MDPQFLLEVANTDPQVCWFWFLLGAITKGAAVAGKAAAATAKVAATTIAKGASAGGGAAASGATAATTTAAPAAAATAAPAAAATAAPAATAPAAATPLEQFVNVAPSPGAGGGAPAATPAATPVPIQRIQTEIPATAPVPTAFRSPQASGTATPTTFSEGTLSPSAITLGGGTATGSSITPPPIEPGVLKRIMATVQKFRESELGQIVENVKEIGDKNPPRETQADPGTPQAEQQLAPEPQLRVPQLERAASADLGLAKGGKDKEPPLTLAQIRELQRSGILDLVAQLRTQRRLFG